MTPEVVYHGAEFEYWESTIKNYCIQPKSKTTKPRSFWSNRYCNSTVNIGYMKSKDLIFIIATFVGLSGCSTTEPVILELTTNDIRKGKCEFTYGVNKTYTSIDSFIKDNKKEIIKDNRGCKCDTVFIDINDFGGMLKYDSLTYWGIGVSCKRIRER